MWQKNDLVKCKNCIHLNVCDGLYFNLDVECLRSCGYFNDRSEYVKVVRCKTCNNRGNSSCPLYSEELFEWDDDGYMESDIVIHDCTIDNGFCYLGEREDNDK